jgi:hypothetical protein
MINKNISEPDGNIIEIILSSSITELILDVKYHIASFFSDVWIIFAIYDTEFRKYAFTNEGILSFRSLFTIKINRTYGVEYTLLGLNHNEGDLPAIITNGSEKYWFKSGKIHRDNDLPAIVYHNRCEWWMYGLRHRLGDKPAIITDTSLIWYHNGMIHRDKLPALICDGKEEWYEYGERR